MDARGITVALGGRWQGQYGLCRCPVHADRTPSLKVTDDERKSDGVDVHCFAGCRWEDVKAELVRQGLLPQFVVADNKLFGQTSGTPRISLKLSALKTEIEDARKLKRAELIWRTAVSLPNTLGFRYFTKRRGLHIGGMDLSRALRWHENIGAVVALMTDPITNEPCGVHRTFLNKDGTKRERKMLGKQGVVRLSPDEDITQSLGIAEGIETALGVLTTGWAPVWATTSAGATERFPPFADLALTIFADEDEPGMAAASLCAKQWTAAGREVPISHPKDALP